LDLLLPRSNLGKVAGKLAARAPEVDLERERVLALAVLEHPLQRGVRDEATVPVVFTLDLDGRKARRQRAASHHVLGADRPCRVVETDEVAGACVDGANGEVHFTRIDAIEIDELFQRRLETLGLVKARRFEAAGRL